MSDFTTVMDRYLAAWNATDPEARRAAVDEAFADDVRYVDPLAAVEGRDALAELIGAAQKQFPGMVFTAGGPIDGHHDQARFTWNLGPADGDPLVVGFDVAEVDRDGRIRQVLGFLDKVPG